LLDYFFTIKTGNLSGNGKQQNMKDLFGNRKPVAIEIDIWWFNGRIIEKQNDIRLPKWISYSDDYESYLVTTHSSKKEAILFATKNPCSNPLNFPRNYIGIIK